MGVDLNERGEGFLKEGGQNAAVWFVYGLNVFLGFVEINHLYVALKESGPRGRPCVVLLAHTTACGIRLCSDRIDTIKCIARSAVP